MMVYQIGDEVTQDEKSRTRKECIQSLGRTHPYASLKEENHKLGSQMNNLHASSVGHEHLD